MADVQENTVQELQDVAEHALLLAEEAWVARLAATNATLKGVVVAKGIALMRDQRAWLLHCIAIAEGRGGEMGFKGKVKADGEELMMKQRALLGHCIAISDFCKGQCKKTSNSPLLQRAVCDIGRSARGVSSGKGCEGKGDVAKGKGISNGKAHKSEGNGTAMHTARRTPGATSWSARRMSPPLDERAVRPRIQPFSCPLVLPLVSDGAHYSLD